MAILEIAHMGNPIIRDRSNDVDINKIKSAQIQNIIDDLIETMHEYDGAGLAAPQVHINLRIVVFEISDNPRYPDAPKIPLTIAINPTIKPLTDELHGMWEGCLSIPGIKGYCERPTKVEFSAYDRDGNYFKRQLEGFAAIVAQHEYDHLDGKLFIDKVKDTRKLAFIKEYEEYIEK